MFQDTPMPTITRALRRFLAAAAAVFAIGAAHGQAQAPAPEQVAPDVLVKNVTMEVVDLIAKDKEIQAGSRAKLIDLIEAKVLPNFNFPAMTALALGQSWNKATAEQKKRLVEEFRTLLVRTYASALAAFAGQKFDFRPLRAKATDTDVTVNVRVIQSGAQPVAIDYSMEKTSSGWKVYDVMVGGVSLVANYRTEFTNVVRESGVDGLIKNLQTKNRPPAAAQAGAPKQ
jgi:phospholipid transport system substrate-binding protein